MAQRGPKAALYKCRGEIRTIRAWAELVGLPPSVVRGRLRAGWPLDAAIFTPLAESPRPSAFRQTRKSTGCRYAKNFASSRDGNELYCDYLLMHQKEHPEMSKHARPCRFEDCAGWDRKGRWRGPGPEPEEEGKQETNSKGG